MADTAGQRHALIVTVMANTAGRGRGGSAKALRLMVQGKLFYFKTYLGAATQARNADLISHLSLRRVYEAIVSSAHMAAVAGHEKSGSESSGSVDAAAVDNVQQPLEGVPPLGKDFHLWCSQITADLSIYERHRAQLRCPN